MLNGWRKIVIPAVILALGIGIFWLFLPAKKVALPQQKCSQKYLFISQEIDCETIDEAGNQVNQLHGNIAEIIQTEKDRKNIMRASVFYRDLRSRRWFGINDLEKYYPASLLKLPLAITYYKISELQPDIFNQQLIIPTEGEDPENADQFYRPENPLVPGNAYTVREMIEHMLLYSDNAPFSVLADSSKFLGERVFADLGVQAQSLEAGQAAWNFSPRIFANIFRMLYNASYINVKNSNEILDLLSRSSFKQGMAAGVPEGVKVAHKFGEVTKMSDENKVYLRVLNDCGIVYKPDSPYILCVMVEGNDFSQMEKIIQEISTSAYDAL